MPNIGALLKEEISRLSRKETRAQLEALKRASAQYRQSITALRRQLITLEREVARLSRQQANGAARAAAAGVEEEAPKVRFSSKWLRPAREKLGLSAADYGKLAGVTAQSVYNWERGATEPRGAQLQAIGELRGIGKREAKARLEALGAEKPKRAKRARKPAAE
jgi:DNA-binding transcriptional regulator YiaG